MSPSSHRETKWTGKLAQDRCFSSKLAPMERRTPLRFQPGIPTGPLLSWRWPGEQLCQTRLPLPVLLVVGQGFPAASWSGTAGLWGDTHAPGGSALAALAQAQGSGPFGTSITAPPLAQTDGEQAWLHLLWLFGHYRELFRPTQIWLAGVRTPNANILAGAAVSQADETLHSPSRPGRGEDLPYKSSWDFLTWMPQIRCSAALPSAVSHPQLHFRHRWPHDFCQGWPCSQGSIPKH